MKQSAPSPIVFCFGPFELRAESGELRKSGTLLKLQPQPAQLLLLLVSHPGEIVRREQIQQTVWGDDTLVDYDMGVNRCIRQIRSVLLDNPESPRYIRTIPRQGYSFIAPVEQIRRDDSDPELLTEADNRLKVQEAVRDEASPLLPSIVHLQTEEIPGEQQGNLPRAKWRIESLALAIACILIVMGVVQYLRLPAPAPRIESYVQLTNDSYNKVIKTGEFARSIFADSARVYFLSFTGAATSEIAEVSQAGGDISFVRTSLASPVLLDYSAARSEFLLSSGPGIGDIPLWIQPAPAGSARQIPEISAHGGCWSPDGEQMAYASQNSLYLASRSGTNSRLLARFDAQRGQRAYWLRWSGDGQSIRFSLYDASTHASSLWEISSHGGDPRHILSGGPANDNRCCGTWTPDGRYYLFVSSDAGRNDIWAAPAKMGFIERFKRSEQPVQLTAGPLSYFAPEPSKDGSRIFVMGEARRSELMRYDSAEGNFQPFAAGVSASQVDFSRNGKWLAFVASRDDSLWRSRDDGTEQTQLSFPPLKITAPRWSPDGTEIAFSGHLTSEQTAIYVISALSGAPRKLVSEKNHDEMDPDWSADRQKLVFSDASRAESASAIKIYNFHTGEITTVANSAGLRSPRWSPDGLYLSALTTDLNHLLLYETATGKWRPLASFRMGYPNWSHDSRYIYLVNLAVQPSIGRIRIADGKMEPIVDMARRGQYWTNDAWLGLTPQDAPLLSRDISIQQIFALRWSHQ